MISSAELHRFLRTRRSVRRFRSDAIPTETVERILVTAIQAASAHNRQPWRFAVVTDPERRHALAEAMAAAYEVDLLSDGHSPAERAAALESARSRLEAAPIAVILCMDLSDMDSYPDATRNNAELLMAVQSVANAGTTLLLAAHAEGLGAVWNCAPLFAPAAVSRALELPQSWRPQAMLLLGMPAVVPGPRLRRPLSEITLYR